METTLIYTDDSSNKFWRIHVTRKTFTVTYGKIGTVGAIKTKTFETEEDCRKESEKLIKSKRRKGYQFARSSQLIMRENTMTEARFWELLNKCHSKGEYAEEQIDWLITHLSCKPIKEIVMFDYIFKSIYNKSYTSDLWAAAFIVLGGCSDDCFDYFRAWVLYQGKEAYEAAIANPESLLPYFKELEAEGMMPQLEDFLYVASLAYEEKTGLEEDDYCKIYEQLVKDDPIEPDMELEWEEDDEEWMQNRFPELWEAYGDNPLDE
ncbi:MAG: DUF4240 domain-containing protein [Bacillus sp. (in: firmicutes)]